MSGICRRVTFGRCRLVWAVTLVVLPLAHAQAQPDVVFRDPTFEQLAATVVTSVARKEQNSFSASAAVYVISAEDIRRSGVRSIPEALRLAPGVEVARLNTHRYAVSIRGFNNEFTTKLLLLQDGRSLYAPLFAGTFWDMEDTLLDDIERIEVVRGPGGTAWGANAVNGVINIVTKSARDTQGLLATAGAGTEEKLFGTLRYGGQFASDSAYRVYLTGASRDESVFATGVDSGDTWQQVRGGFRIDSALNKRDNLTVQGDVYDGTATEIMRGAPSDIDSGGAYLLGRWQRTFAANEELSLQFYYDTSRRQTGQGVADRKDWAVELVQRSRLGERNDFTYGLNYRSSDNHAVTVPGLIFIPPARTLVYKSAFVDDAMKFLDDQLTVSAGLKVEHNDFTGAEWLPNVRAMWQPQPNQAVWAAISRGARMPSIADNDSTTDLPGPPRFLSLPNTELPSETLTAYELGWRMHAHDLWSIDVALFSNHYDDLRSRESMFIPAPPTRVQMRDAQMFGSTYGVEFVVVTQLSSVWRLQANASYLEMELALEPGSTDITSIADASSSPQWQASVRSSLRLGRQWEVYAQYRYVDALPTLQVASYQSLDVNATWAFADGLELMLVGQNLLNTSHAEFRNGANFPSSSEIQRSAYLQLRWML